MKINIEFPMTEAPDYLKTLIISRDGDFIEIEIADGNNRFKAGCKISVRNFTQAISALGLLT